MNWAGPDAQPHSRVTAVNVLLVYGTTEGQTRKIARFVANRVLQSGQKVLTANAREAAFIPDPLDFDTVIIAAPLHAGRYPRPIIDFVKRHRAAIGAGTNAFPSDSLTAAASDPRDAAGLAAASPGSFGKPAGSPRACITSPERCSTAPMGYSPDG